MEPYTLLSVVTVCICICSVVIDWTLHGLHVVVSVVDDDINGACNHRKCEEEQDHCCIKPYKKLNKKIDGMCTEYRNHTTP